MKAYTRRRVLFHLYLTLALVGVEWPSSCPSYFLLGKNYHVPIENETTEIVVFWDMSHFSLIGCCQCFGEIYCLCHEVDVGNMTSYQESALLLFLIARASQLIYNRLWETRDIFEAASIKNNFLCSKFMSQSEVCLFCSSQNMTIITYAIVCILFIKMVL